MREWLSVLNVRGKAMTEDKHNKHVCLCNECIALRMAKTLDEIEKRAKKEGKLPLSKWIVVIQESGILK